MLIVTNMTPLTLSDFMYSIIGQIIYLKVGEGMRIFGYIKEPNGNQQAMLQAGVEERDIFIERGNDRQEYRVLTRVLREGDTLVIQNIGRLGKNYNEIYEQWRLITQEIKAHIKVIELPLLPVTAETNDIVLQVLSYVAENERRNRKQRQAEGFRLAKEAGKHLGRPKAEFPSNFDEYYNSWKRGEITATAAMEHLKLKRTTFYKLVKIKERKLV